MPRGEINIPVKVPRLGMHTELPDNELPLEAMRDCSNMLRSNGGKLVMRPGYKQTDPVGVGSRCMGGISYVTGNRTVAGTVAGWWHFNGTNWTDITGTPLSGNYESYVQYAIFPRSGIYHAVGVNGTNIPKSWDGSAPTYVDIPNAPCRPFDVTVSANRCIMIEKPNRLYISEFNDHFSWPGLIADMADAGDIMILIERLTRTSFSILGEASQWVGKAQAGRFPFRFDIVDEQPGPMSVNSCVRDGFVQYYIGIDGNVYRFDGIRCTRVGNAMQRYVQQNYSYENRFMAWGVLLEDFRTIFFFFPSNINDAPDIGIFYNVDSGEMGRLSYGEAGLTMGWKYRNISTLTYDDLDDYSATYVGLDVFFPTYLSMAGQSVRAQMFGDTLGVTHVSGNGPGSDNGANVEGKWELALMNPGGEGQNFRLDTFETYFTKTANPTTVEISVGVTDTLMSEPPFYEVNDIELQIDERKDLDLQKLDMDKRFITVRHRVTTTTGHVEWNRGVLYGDPKRPGPS
jgi:hypothetical protein